MRSPLSLLSTTRSQSTQRRSGRLAHSRRLSGFARRPTPPSYLRRGLLCLNGMSGYHPVLVVGETPKQYRIEAIERMRRRRRDRYLLSKKAESPLMR